MKLFFRYLKEYKKDFLLLLVFTAIFIVIFALYDTNTEAVIYSFLICGVIEVIIVVTGFLRFRGRHILLNEIYINLPIMASSLPFPDTLAEEDMQNIIKKLAEINRQTVTAMRNLRNDSIDYFTVWAHQIKTPISAMQMILQSEDTGISRELSAELFRIEQYAEMALHYIRLDSDTNDFVIRSYDLDDIIKQAVHRYAPLFIRRKIRLDYVPVNKKVITDEKWLVFVIEQLLSNSVKYTSKGCVSISLKNEILSICDTGIGISLNDLPRIFEKGYTGMSGRTEKKSTGLGLYLCKKVCDKLGHKIYAESIVDIGTTIFIDLSRSKFDIE